MEYNPNHIEQKWKQFWAENQTYKVENGGSKPKFYILNMFPYPSGAGLHVGHPLGYIATDIYARYKRLKGYNVLNPMGYDSFGLPAEQYAIQTGTHPALTTENNIKRYREQLDNIGFSFDWTREVRTSESSFYKWTQWIFMQLFNAYYDKTADKALPIKDLVARLATEGNTKINAVCDEDTPPLSAAVWNNMSEKEQQLFLLKYRLTFPEESFVNWCAKLGTVLSNDEVKEGVSERGGYPVERKLMKQWAMRITAYADRLIDGLNNVDWSESLKEQQRNWIGRSQGASVKFPIASPKSPSPPTPKGGDVTVRDLNTSPPTPKGGDVTVHDLNTISITTSTPNAKGQGETTPPLGVGGLGVRGLGVGELEVFTTRVDTLFGVTFMVLAPEHEYVAVLTTPEQKDEIEAYQKWAASRSDVDRMAETRKVSGAFTGSYCLNPLSGVKIPIYIADYVLASYGTGAVMAVPSGDQRDWNFAKQFNLPIVPILDTQKYIDASADNTKEGRYINSDFINGMSYKEATQAVITALEAKGLGKGKIQYRLRNAVFSRQRYWGEPVPAYWKDGVPYLIEESELPLVLPEIEKYLPTETGEPPLGRAENWKYYPQAAPPAPKGGAIDEADAVSPPLGVGGLEYELSTMPGWAGSSWYFYRYMDPSNPSVFADKKAVDYWQQVDLYVGGTEHAVGHLLYSRFWNLFMYDWGLVPETEYAKKLINQGMIQGRTLYLNLNTGRRLFVNVALADEKDRLYHDVYLKMANDDNRFEGINPNIDPNTEGGHIDWETDEQGRFFCTLTPEVEKMSKRTMNVVNPDDMVAKYGADCFRMYEMFLGPLEDSKPWSTTGITGVSGFLRKLWSLFYDLNTGKKLLAAGEPTADELKILHACIKKVNEDIERFSFNTAVAAFMICVNELKSAKCHKAAILKELVVLVAPFAPFIAEELWSILGETPSVLNAVYPTHNEDYLKESAFTYPISINGKRRAEYVFAADASTEDVEKVVRALEIVTKWTEGKAIKKVIVIKDKMVNVVV
ncbi:MAG: class I tRNA ligase family protein [Saprospiraceae bacterium]|nr:class I tRNA ligase family protein [Saprospiraceae bacterium]